MDDRNTGIFRTNIGDIAVTALNDLIFEFPGPILTNISEPEVDAMLTAAFRPRTITVTVNAYLLRIAGKTVLVDTGVGLMFGPPGGALAAGLASLGIAPDQIDAVLLTHAHSDHVGGLIGQDGNAAYPNAELILNEVELKFWTDPATPVPEGRQGSFETARKALTLYKSSSRVVADGQEALPGVTAMLLPGHTPGHTGWMLSSGASSLLIWGDIVHLPPVQFARPEVGVLFDSDGAQAIETRKRVFDMAATDQVMVAGMHHEFQPFGHVAQEGAAYRFIPALWRPQP